jgi:hypothetical protein
VTQPVRMTAGDMVTSAGIGMPTRRSRRSSRLLLDESLNPCGAGQLLDLVASMGMPPHAVVLDVACGEAATRWACTRGSCSASPGYLIHAVPTGSIYSKDSGKTVTVSAGGTYPASSMLDTGMRRPVAAQQASQQRIQ